VLQRDLQRNILVRADPLEIRRVDVHHAVVKREVSELERRNNIALLNATVPLRDEFFAGYGWTPEQTRATRERSDEIRRARHFSRSFRCLKRTTHFQPKRFGGMKWHLRAAALNPELERLLKNPDEWLRTCGKLFKGFERSSTVGAGGGVVLKRFNFRKPGNLFKDLFRQSRALRAFQKAHHLETLRIATPRPIAAAEKRLVRVLLASYLVTEEIPDGRELGEYLQGVSRIDRNVVRAVAELVGRLHEEGFSHRDMKETNLLLDANLGPHLIDLDGLKFMHRVPDQRAGADLARLARAASKYPVVARSERILFLKRYCACRGLKRVPRP
jgi:tRNA A-37 threonylcarbamoyl transferase component Bud32